MKLPWYIKVNKFLPIEDAENHLWVNLEFNKWWIRYQLVKYFIIGIFQYLKEKLWH